MSKTTTQERLAALADVAEAARRLRQALPPDIDLSDLVDAVTALAVLVVCGGMTATAKSMLCPVTVTQPPAPKGKPGRKPKAETAETPSAQVKTGKRAYVRKDKPGEPTGKAADPAADPADTPKKMMGVCVDCGTSYLKTSNVQKRCPGCGVARKAAVAKADQSSASLDRLSRIKAIDKKLDTIPGGPADV